MNAILLILIAIVIFISATTLYLITKTDETEEKILDLMIRLSNERERITNIVLYAELTNENRLEMARELEKELGIPNIQPNSNSQNTHKNI